MMNWVEPKENLLYNINNKKKAFYARSLVVY